MKLKKSSAPASKSTASASTRLPAPTPTPSPTPTWKISPGGANRYINSVAVSANGARVVGGTFYHSYGGATLRRKPPHPDALTLASGPDTGTFGTYCYDSSGRQVWKNEFQGWQGVYWVAISADGSKAASGGLMRQKTSTSPQAGFVRAFDGATGAMLLDYATQQRTNQVALSSDGTWLIAGAENLVLFKYDSISKQYAVSDTFTPPPAPQGDWNGIVSTAISADGRTVVFADYNGHLGVFANTAGKLVLQREWKLPGTKTSDFCHMVDLAPNGSVFAAGGSAGVFYYFNVAGFIANGAPTCTCSTGFNEAVYGVAVASDGSSFVGVVNQGEAGCAILATVVNQQIQRTAQMALWRNPNSASVNVAQGLLAIADGHPDGTPGHFYLFNNIAGVPDAQWVYETGNMSWPVVISANGAVAVGGSDDTNMYYFTLNEVLAKARPARKSQR